MLHTLEVIARFVGAVLFGLGSIALFRAAYRVGPQPGATGITRPAAWCKRCGGFRLEESSRVVSPSDPGPGAKR